METKHSKGADKVAVILLGIVLVLIVMAVGYVVFGPFHITTALFNSSYGEEQSETATAGTNSSVDNTDVTAPAANVSFSFSEEQKDALNGFGIDSATVPSTITPVQVACFEEKLGAGRVSEIRNGDVPSAFEFFKVKNCIN